MSQLANNNDSRGSPTLKISPPLSGFMCQSDNMLPGCIMLLLLLLLLLLPQLLLHAALEII